MLEWSGNLQRSFLPFGKGTLDNWFEKELKGLYWKELGPDAAFSKKVKVRRGAA